MDNGYQKVDGVPLSFVENGSEGNKRQAIDISRLNFGDFNGGIYFNYFYVNFYKDFFLSFFLSFFLYLFFGFLLHLFADGYQDIYIISVSKQEEDEIWWFTGTDYTQKGINLPTSMNSCKGFSR